MIKQIQYSELECCVSIIQQSFSDIAEKFNITRDNCPTHTSFTTMQNLQHHWDNGYLMHGYYLNNTMIGYASLEIKGLSTFELRNLAVLPEYRHMGYGKQILDFCKMKVRELNGNIITLGIIEENTMLKNWYIANGFIHIGTKLFEHLPFTVGFMECTV